MIARLQRLLAYCLRHGFQQLSVLAFVTFVLYMGFYRSFWGDFSSQGSDRGCFMSAETFERIRAVLGYQGGPLWGYAMWAGGEDWLDEVGRSDLQPPACQQNPAKCNQGILRGDLGESWALARDQPTESLIETRRGSTLLLLGSAMGLAMAVAVPLGVGSALAAARGSRLGGSVALWNGSVPVFWLALMAIVCVAGSQSFWHQRTGLPYLPVHSRFLVREAQPGSWHAALGASPGSLLDGGLHLVLPTLTLALAPTLRWSRFVHRSLLAAQGLPFVRAARGKELSERDALLRHALHTVWAPLATEVCRTLPSLLSALLLVEVIFNWPGVGRIFVMALGANDFPLAMAAFLFTVELGAAPALLAEAVRLVADPRTHGPRPVAAMPNFSSLAWVRPLG